MVAVLPPVALAALSCRQLEVAVPVEPNRPSAPVSAVQQIRAWITWFGAGRLIASAVSIIAVCSGALWLVRAPSPQAEANLPYAGRAGSVASTQAGDAAPAATAAGAAAISTSTVAPTIIVHVAGQVVTPGVFHLAVGARVVDAIELAGGLAPAADADVINLASPLADGQRIYVPMVGQVPPPVVAGTGGVSPPAGSVSGAGTTGSSGGPVAINSATAEELDSLPGVGPATAAAIIAHRDQHGPFSSVEQLGDVRGIGPAKLEALRDLVTV
jgi:competence protein ComEA